MYKIEPESKTASQQKQQEICQHAARQITCRDQCERKFDIFRIKYFSEAAIYVTDIHIDQTIKANRGSKKDIQKKTTEKSGQKTSFPTAHNAYRRCEYNHKIRYNTIEKEIL